MIRDLQKRLARLERNRPPEPVKRDPLEKHLSSLWFFSIAYYLGEATPKESPMEAYVRAMGYETIPEWKAARNGSDPNHDSKFYACKRRLFSKFGVNVDSSKPEELQEALQRMQDGLSEDYKDRIRGILLDKSY